MGKVWFIVGLVASRYYIAINATNIINPIVDDYDFTDDSYILDVTSKERGKDYE